MALPGSLPMTTDLITQLVLRQTSAEPAVSVSRDFLLVKGDAVQVGFTILAVGGTDTSVTVLVEVSNDRETWTTEVTYAGPAYVAYFAVQVPSLAVRWLRLRIAVGSSAMDGNAVFSATVREAELRGGRRTDGPAAARCFSARPGRTRSWSPWKPSPAAPTSYRSSRTSGTTSRTGFRQAR